MNATRHPEGEHDSAQRAAAPSTAATLTVELLTEELPPKALKRLGEAFAAAVAAGLVARGFVDADPPLTSFATPRRLAVCLPQVLARSPDKAQRVKLLPASVGFDAAGAPTPALLKKLATLGLDAAAIPALERAAEGKAETLFVNRTLPGEPLATGLDAIVGEAIAALPIPKVMTYQRANGTTVRFVRPAHRLLALHGADIVPITALGLAADRLTDGHRFLGRSAIAVATAGAYDETLRAEGKVIAGFAERRAAIVAGLEREAGSARVIMPDALLDEVTALVEWPAVYAGSFDPAFLQVPQECLILTMQQNQKYFALASGDGKLQNRFLVVSNLATADPAAIIGGNERVLRARLADAKFFFDQDRRVRLEARVDRLASVVYHNRIGTQRQRIDRIRALAGRIAAMIGADAAATDRAALLAKADLVTDMVGEFPELQGLMGRYYAGHDGESPAVAAAIEQHYWPRFAGDALPTGPVAQAVSLADKLEALAGMFGIGNEPTGEKDPFGLRRAALGVLRIVIEGRLPLALPDLVAAAFAVFGDVPAVKPAPDALAAFIYDRLRGAMREHGFTANQIAAVVDGEPAQLRQVPVRLEAVRAFEQLPEAAALAAANKRIVNILRKSGGEAASAVDVALLTDGAEHELHLAFQKLGPQVDALCAAGDYTPALQALATAKPVVDRFFDAVMVMADDPAVRGNRLALLSGVAQTMNRVADISRLAT
jgi:glycyl-tRNA synthetase beta chain